MVEATEDVAEAIVEDSVTATVIAFSADLDLAGGVILTGGTTRTILTIILTTIPTTILITLGFTGSRPCLRKRRLHRQNRNNNNLLFGTSVRIQRVTTLMSKIAPGVG